MLNFDAQGVADLGRPVYEMAVRLLVRHGIEVDHPWSRSRILDHAGTRQHDNRIFFTEDCIRQHVGFGQSTDSPDTITFSTEDDAFLSRPVPRPRDGSPRLRNGAFSLAVYDVDTKQLRPSTAADLREALHLCTVLGAEGHYPCTDTTVHPALRNLVSHKLCFTDSAHCSTHVCAGVEQAEVIHEMYRVMDLQMPVTLTIVWPFRVERTNLEVIRFLAERGATSEQVRIVPVGYGLGGVNYPLSLAGSFAMCLAEHMGLKLVGRFIESPFDIAPHIGPAGMCPVDFRSVCIGAGNAMQPAYSLVSNVLVHEAMGRSHENAPPAQVDLYTGATVPDEQAATEKTAHAMVGAMHGGTVYSRLGNLCVDDVFSCEQMLLDIETVNFARDAVAACTQLDPLIDLEGIEREIDDMLAGDGSFLMAPGTLENLRKVVPTRQAFRHQKLASVSDRSLDKLIRKQQARKHELLKQYNYELPKDKKTELDSIYRRAETSITT